MATLANETALVAGAPAGNLQGDGTLFRSLWHWRMLAATGWREPLAVFSLALVPRLTGLANRPFWSDEFLTQQRAALPLTALIRNSFAGHHTPLYFLLIAPMAHLPDPQFWLRLPSAILGALNVMLVFLITARAGGRTAGTAAAIITGLAPTEIAFSQEARSYMLMIFFLLIALHALTSLALSGERTARPWRTGGQARLWLQFTAGSTGAFCTLGDSLPWLLASGVTAAVLISRAKNRRGLLRNFAIADAISLACSLPLYVMMRVLAGSVHHVGQALGTKLALVWYDIESIYLMRICDFITPHFMAVPTPRTLTLCIGSGLTIATLGGMWRLRRNPMMAACLLPAAWTLPVLFGIISIFKPILLARYWLWSGPPVAMLAGIGIAAALENCRPPVRYGALAAASLLLLVNLGPFYRSDIKPRWDLAAQVFAAHANPRDVAYYCDPGGTWSMRYYLPATSQPHLRLDDTGDLRHAERALARGKRVWAIYGDAWNLPDWKSLADFKATLAPLGTPSVEFNAGSRITLWRYDPAKTQLASIGN